MALEPSLWGTLPKELLDLVFACLPVSRIGQLRVLSKEWKKNMDCKDSEFNQVLDATIQLNMFALLPLRNNSRFGYIYNVQAHKFHVYELDADFVQKFKILIVVDGGLVCFISIFLTWRDRNPGVCYVMNPLTKQKMQLPPLLCIGAKKSNPKNVVVKTVKLMVDKKTKNYEVFVVGSIIDGGEHFFAEVYNSNIKKWMVVEATHGHIIGWNYLGMLEEDFEFSFARLCVYNCANGTLHRFHRTDIAPGLHVNLNCYVLVEDNLFILHKEASLGPYDLLEDSDNMPTKYCISEFHLPEKATTWMKLRAHSCSPCKRFLEKPAPNTMRNLRLMGCNGFLLVYGIGSNPVWQYNLSTYEWRNLPAFEKPINPGPKVMCSISWSAMA